MSIQELAKSHPTPFLAVSRHKLSINFHQLKSALPVSGIHFAVKSNPDVAVLRVLAELGAKFEIASTYELDVLQQIGLEPGEILFSNPVKSAASVRLAYAAGVRSFAVDSFSEIEKISENAPGSNIFIRLLVNDFSSKIPLSKKFGIHPSEAVDAAVYAVDRGLVPLGLTFHVGSQCTSTDLWDFALQSCGKVMRALLEKNIRLHALNIGGGFPVEYNEPVPEIGEIGVVLEHAMKEYLPYKIQLLAEPGRYLVAEAGTLVTSVIARSVRSGKNWIYTDTSAFHGLLETMPCQGQIQYPIAVLGDAGDDESKRKARYIITGPTCDYLDTYANNVLLPIDITENSLLAISVTGAYTVPFASYFNGFPPPKVVLYD